MLEAEFQMLCADDGRSCSRVKEIMHDFKLNPSNKIDGFDHSGIRSFSDMKEIFQRLDEIKSKAGNDLIDVEIVIKK